VGNFGAGDDLVGALLSEREQVQPTNSKTNSNHPTPHSIDLAAAEAILANYTPRASVIPANLDFTDCPNMWPYCRQPLYAFGMPLAFNATVLNGMGVTGKFAGPPKFTPANEGGGYLAVSFTFSDVLWPWTGFLGVFIEVGRRRLGCLCNGRRLAFEIEEGLWGLLRRRR
jgi:hypothetical protein